MLSCCFSCFCFWLFVQSKGKRNTKHASKKVRLPTKAKASLLTMLETRKNNAQIMKSPHPMICALFSIRSFVTISVPNFGCCGFVFEHLSTYTRTVIKMQNWIVGLGVSFDEVTRIFVLLILGCPVSLLFCPTGKRPGLAPERKPAPEHQRHHPLNTQLVTQEHLQYRTRTGEQKEKATPGRSLSCN